MCKQEFSPDKSTKIYTRKEIVIMETTISDFHTSFYILAIQKLAFHLPHVHILRTNQCGELRRTAFKRRELFQDVLCRRDYAERVVASVANQTKSEYYGENISVSIEVLHYNILVQHHRQISINLHFRVHGMQYFTLFYLMIGTL